MTCGHQMRNAKSGGGTTTYSRQMTPSPAGGGLAAFLDLVGSGSQIMISSSSSLAAATLAFFDSGCPLESSAAGRLRSPFDTHSTSSESSTLISLSRAPAAAG